MVFAGVLGMLYKLTNITVKYKKKYIKNTYTHTENQSIGVNVSNRRGREDNLPDSDWVGEGSRGRLVGAVGEGLGPHKPISNSESRGYHVCAKHKRECYYTSNLWTKLWGSLCKAPINAYDL